MLGTAVTRKSFVLMIRENQVQSTGADDAAKEVVPEEAVTKDAADDTDASTSLHTHHP